MIIKPKRGDAGSYLISVLLHDYNDDPMTNYYKHIHINNAILAATSRSSETIHDSFYDLNNKFDIKSLHIIGKTDYQCPK